MSSAQQSPESKAFLPLAIAILTVSDSRTPATDKSGDKIAELASQAGHRIAARRISADDTECLRTQLRDWIVDPAIDVIIATGGTGVTGRDVTPEALAPLISKPIPGFGELFRMLSYQEIGTSTIQSRAEAAICDGTIVFLLPGSTGAVRLGMEAIIIPQLDIRHRPCNLSELLPRIRHEH
ncbi:Molybdenum cofactor biosynthesis protein B [Acidithiobacillus ferrivorans]|uniref:Molybdenum cofactor biosynthesis protein B n=1 Tax=Acidithiobacillus ferrivorans TaxID=160808 RepID=A0A060USE8_9PROT|nr:molybdenum cofactor biosynthesis protein B [Acidithiobacillus ferrivorans]CDQ09723.1 Molybdenum cofactor biosynthesis protein B [Acidithiobacillus ferrivorans]SMH66463.1 Molybdenum cofactor biosynthesis protein B [Acidithiobacillus ferrivorans]